MTSPVNTDLGRSNTMDFSASPYYLAGRGRGGAPGLAVLRATSAPSQTATASRTNTGSSTSSRTASSTSTPPTTPSRTATASRTGYPSGFVATSVTVWRNITAGGPGLSVAELQAWSAAGENVARLGSATATSSLYSWSTDAFLFNVPNINDGLLRGIISTPGAVEGVWIADGLGQQSATIVFPSPQLIVEVVVFAYVHDLGGVQNLQGATLALVAADGSRLLHTVGAFESVNGTLLSRWSIAVGDRPLQFSGSNTRTPSPTATGVPSGVLASFACEYTYWTVPPSTSALSVQLWGGGGMEMQPYGLGADGAYVEGVLPVVPGEVVRLTVGSSSMNLPAVGWVANLPQCGLPGGSDNNANGGGFTGVARNNGSHWLYVAVAGGGGAASGFGDGRAGVGVDAAYCSSSSAPQFGDAWPSLTGACG